MNTNMAQLFQMIQSSGNPQQFVLNMMQERVGNNPFFNNLLELAKQDKTGDIEAIARNMFREKGLDFDKEFNSFRNSLGIK